MNKIWPSGDNKAVLCIRMSYIEFSKRHNIEFKHFIDDLGEYNAALISIPDIGNVAIRERDNFPRRGVDFTVDSFLSPAIAIQAIKEFFDLRDEDVTWMASD